jgi:thiosulfate/3-mercaptopyruvate sulfurtransferase
MAARLWWLLRFLGHESAAVLDGGWPEWVRRGYPTRSGDEENTRRIFFPRPQRDLIVNAAAVDDIRSNPSYSLLDARDSERFRGEVEPIDPVAGHIPGAVSAPYMENLDERGFFRPSDELRTHYKNLVGNTPPERIVCYCGSGVTAAHDVLAIAHAGLGIARLYPGSWSEWITNPDRPVARD